VEFIILDTINPATISAVSQFSPSGYRAGLKFRYLDIPPEDYQVTVVYQVCNGDDCETFEAAGEMKVEISREFGFVAFDKIASV